MKHLDSISFLAVFIVLVSCHQGQNQMPAPIDGTSIAEFGEESGDNQAKREKWIADMHKAAPGDDWKEIEYRNQVQRVNKIKVTSGRAACEVTESLPVEFDTEWIERGSANQSGSVLATDYNSQDEKIYLISVGGTMWKGLAIGDAWEVVNQDFQFGNRSLKIVHLPNSFRILSSINGRPVYSDDGGASWETAAGINISNASNAQLLGFEELAGGELFCWAKGSYWDDFQLYRSLDAGLTWTSIYTTTSNSINHFAVCKPHHSNDLFLFLKPAGEVSQLLRWDNDNAEFQNITEFVPDFTPGTRAYMIGDLYDDQFRLFVLGSDNWLYKTYDLGATWDKLDKIPSNPWTVGLFVSPTDSNLLLSGEVDLWKSVNGGEHFERQNGWADYYDDPYGKLHADMMYFNEFEIYGLSMLAISHHGGISLSSDHMQNVGNISLQSLNVGQYYSVRTDPYDKSILYAGSQDQGFQRGTIDLESNESANFDQVISGDYGHIVFSNFGSGMWTVYPGGWVTFYNNPQNGYLAASYEVISDDESTWLPALAAIPQSTEHEILMAGGNINAGTGSYLIKLSYQAGEITAEQFDYDFLAEGGDVISSIEVSRIDPNLIYVGSQNGTFFFSEDGGLNWTKGNDFLPTGHYLYGAAIHASNTNPGEVYYAGSGYSNEAMWVSTNNGLDFMPMGNGIPETLVFDLDGSTDDNWIFAATENGPYMYIKDEDSWYSLTSDCLPVQTYWSVEWVEENNIARFGTYGRGIWDINFEPFDVATDDAKELNALKIYPNPTQDFIFIEQSTQEKFTRLELFNSSGLKVKSWNPSAGLRQLSLKDLAAGTYFLQATSKNESSTSKIVKTN